MHLSPDVYTTVKDNEVFSVPLIFSPIQRGALLLRKKIGRELQYGSFALCVSDRTAIWKAMKSPHSDWNPACPVHILDAVDTSYLACAGWAWHAPDRGGSGDNFWSEGWAWGPAPSETAARTTLLAHQGKVCSYSRGSASPAFLDVAPPGDRPEKFTLWLQQYQLT